MEKTLHQAILVKSLEILSAEEETELDLILSKDETTMEQVFDFLRSKIPTFDILVMEESQKLKQNLITTTS